MARRRTPPVPEHPVLTTEQLRRRVERLQGCIHEIEGLDLEKVQKRDGDPEVMRVEAAVEGALAAAFGHGTPSYNRYWRAAELDKGRSTMHIEPMWGGGSPAYYDAQHAGEARRYLAEGKPRSIALLRSAISELEAEIADREPPSAVAASPEPGRPHDLSKVFVVHGHDEAIRETVARFIEKLGFDAIILHERPNKGRTIITKFREEAAGVGFAVVLMTPDDVGGKPPLIVGINQFKPRARQNVVFELGFLLACLALIVSLR